MIQEPQIAEIHIPTPTYNRTPVKTTNNLKIVGNTKNSLQFQRNQNLIKIPKEKTIIIQTPTNRAQIPQTRIAKTRIIRVPFLPRSEQLTLIVKRNPIKTQGLVKNIITETHLNDQNTFITHPQAPVTTLTGTDCNYTLKSSNNLANIISVQELPQIPIATKTKTKPTTTSMATQTPTMTLASMAGIQLTSTDSEFLQDMSGAMPTATVEEINVPVFIDEYLQQSSPTFTDAANAVATTATTTTSNTFNNNQPNNSNNGNGNDFLIEEHGTFENFDFDIDMIAQSFEEQMFSNAHIDNNIGSIANNNKFDMSNYICNNNNNIEFDNNNFNSNLENIIDWCDEIKEEPKESDLEQQYHLPPNSTNELITFSDDTIDLDINDSISLTSNEEAIDFSQEQARNDMPLSEFFQSSQHNPLLCSNSYSNSQSLSAIVSHCEPILPDLEELKYDPYCRLSTSQILSDIMLEDKMYLETDEIETKCTPSCSNGGNSGLKRLSSFNLSTNKDVIAQKKRKLVLDTTKQPTFNPVEDMKTPDVVNFLSEMSGEPNIRTSNRSEIINHLLSDSNSSFHSVDGATLISGTGDLTNNFNDDQSPYTPLSCTSSHTNQTSFAGFTTVPNSPTPSSTSTSNAATKHCSNRRKRGRPSKQHSDRPDPSHLSRLSENERKRLEDRYKNNEASRQSRLKNRQREEAEIMEEQNLLEINAQLKIKFLKYSQIVEALKGIVKEKHFAQKT
ncbi:probable serine/threonine-protein kinase DDB_G0282963 [Teleopsis dalmanni]|uniref:probable serine/threonine-protein kinase DDB_G0282963 n=1 Tax=Teleopsis dalmanni TaxID=139649 RepID=UPI0018CE48B7|nr:probable serine/threonine-protein kinase DDB_G0282963 [Teleopsis dalmanni]XP_037955935.1 probable serine/threonine-protein kinase DDB_G0282963 [Teleopsis dalmanni]